jgi:hypothetical protein
LSVVQWLIEHRGASVTDRNMNGFTALLYAALNLRLGLMEWLMRYGGADITDTTNAGQTMWYLIAYNRGLNRLPVEQLSPLLKTMLARGVPPPYFIRQLPPSLLPLLAQGAMVMQRMPANSPWRAQRTAALNDSACGQRLIPGILAVIGGYAFVSEEELWTLA